MSILVDHEIASLCLPDVKYSRMKQFDISFVGFDNYEQIKENFKVRGAMKAVEKVGSIIGQNYSLVEARRYANHLDELAVGCASPILNTPFGIVGVTRLPDALPMIDPYTPKSVKQDEHGNKLLSYGVSSAGYDFRVAPEFKIFHNAASQLVDPKNFDPNAFITHKGDHCIIPPNSFVLSHTLERFNMPEDIVGLCAGKSTLARVGIFPLVTPAEPEWDGFLTLEFANLTPLPAKIYANEGGLQMLFQKIQRPAVTYKDRGGKYMGQAAEVVLPKV